MTSTSEVNVSALSSEPGEVQPSVSQDSKCGQKLSKEGSRHVAFQTDRILPEALTALCRHDRTMLIEVACSQESILTSTMQKLTGKTESSRRLSIWNQYDLTTGAGVKSILDVIDSTTPEHVWLSPDCGPYSPMQNINQRSDEQVESLKEKRRYALKQYVGSAVIYHYCVQRGIHVTWELSQSCQAWRLPLIQNLIQKFQLKTVVVRGCQVGLKAPNGHFVSKGWKLMSTHPLILSRMDLPCRCSSHVRHEPCEGSLTKRTALYTPEFAKRVCSAILQDVNPQGCRDELHGIHQGCVGFGEGTICTCDVGSQHDMKVVCGHCSQDFREVMDHTHDPPSNDTLALVASKEQVGKSTMSVEQVRKKLYLLHSATGHGPIKHLVRALRIRGAPPWVIKEAENFRCSVCHEKSRPIPRNMSSLEPQPVKLTTVSADVGHWYHPISKEKYQFLLFVDEGSRFRVGRMILQGKKKHMSAALFLSTFKEAWISYFGHPSTLRVDPDGALRSHEISEFCDQQQIFLDIIPGEAHWKIGICERSIQTVKHLLEQVAQEHPDTSGEDALAESIRVMNTRELHRGYSPMQHIMGKAPDETGRFFSDVQPGSPDIVSGEPHHELQKTLELQATAEKALIDWTTRQRLSRASNSSHRRKLDYEPGDLVYIWRKQLTGSDAGQNKLGSGRFVGPARILAVEKKRDQQGDLVPGSSVWLVRGRRLIKCCPEQLRRSSERETIIHELHTLDQQPWDFPRVADELGGNEFDDYSEQPSENEWHRAHDPEREYQPTHRFHQKRPPPATVDERGAQRKRHQDDDLDDPEIRELFQPPDANPSTSSTSSGPIHRLRGSSDRPGPYVRPSKGEPEEGFTAAPHWSNQVEECFFMSDENYTAPKWQDQDYVVSLAIDLPQTRGGSERALRDFEGFLVTNLKRKSVEVSERRLTPEEKEAFAGAKAIEVNNFISAKAFEALPSDKRVRREDAVKMRWLLTWKTREDGSKKAKARAVLLGYQDPLYEHRSTASPTMTRQTRQCQFQIAAGLQWNTRKGDVTGAFLQSREYPGDLFCIPCPEICTAMNLPPESITRVKKACYGLVDAPLEWYRSICDFFQRLGLRRCWSDPCCWTLVVNGKLHGLISGHVDDFLFSGSDSDQHWTRVVDAIKKEFRWGDWESDKFTQCGVLVERHSNGSYSLSQEKYVDDLKHINIRAHRKKDKHSPTDDLEKSQLRALLGGISWHAQQVAPHFSADVGLLLSEVNRSQVDTLFRANQLLDQVKSMREHRMHIHTMDIHDIGIYAWCDAASQNRVDGGSTQGIIIAAAPNSLFQGACERVSFLAWHSSKISRVCSSPGASEAVAAVNAEDLMYFARFQMSEMLGYEVNIRNVNETVNHLPGCLVTDSRNVYDKLSAEVVVAKGAERRTDIDLMRLKESQQVNRVRVRWVHSDAQLSNSLTKTKEMRQLLMYYQMQQQWRIVDDDTMSSARRRKMKGQLPLEHNIQSPERTTHTPHVRISDPTNLIDSSVVSSSNSLKENS